MALKVIGAGLGRTGTLSLTFALEYLGLGPCHHMAEIFANAADQLPKWLGVIGGQPDWDAAFDGFESAVDYPGCTYWRELADKYPDAKIILSVRNPESWFHSVNTTIFSDHMLGRIAQGPFKPFFDTAVTADFSDRIGEQGFHGRLLRASQCCGAGCPTRRARAGLRGEARRGATLRVPRCAGA